MRRVALVLGLVVGVAAGCFGSGHAIVSAKPRDVLSVVVHGLSGQTVHRYTLTCHPDAGSMPHPGTACAAIADYLGRGSPPPRCLGGDASGPTTFIGGRFDHRRFTLELSVQSWCDVPPAAMRDFWTLSTFPCSTVLERIQSFTPLQFARLSGCTGGRPIGDNAPLRESIHG